MPDDARASAYAISLDGKRLATGSAEGQIIVWDLNALTARESGRPKAPGPGDYDGLWSDLAGMDAESAYKANRAFVRAPQLTVDFLKKKLNPSIANDVQAKIAALDDKSFAVREKAFKSLESLGLDAEPDLNAARKEKGSPERTNRLETLYGQIHSRPMPADKLRVARAIAVLEQVGSKEAKEFLRVLAAGAPSFQTGEAKISYERLTRRTNH
jgi:hypothetical protein